MAIDIIHYWAGVTPESLQREVEQAVTTRLSRAKLTEASALPDESSALSSTVQYFVRDRCYVLDQKIRLDNPTFEVGPKQQAILAEARKTKKIFAAVGIAFLVEGMRSGLHKSYLVALGALALTVAASYVIKQANLYEKELADPHYLAKKAIQAIADVRNSVIRSQNSLQEFFRQMNTTNALLSAGMIRFFTGEEIKAFLQQSITQHTAGSEWDLLRGQFITSLHWLASPHSLCSTPLVSGLQAYQNLVKDMPTLVQQNNARLDLQVQRFRDMSQQKCPYNTRWQLSLDYHQGCSEMQKHIDAALVPGLKSFCEQLQAEPSLEAIRPACLDQSLNTCLAEIVSSARLTPHSRPQDRFSGRPGDSLQEYKAWVKGELEKFFDQNKGDPVLIAVRGLLAAKLQIPVPSN